MFMKDAKTPLLILNASAGSGKTYRLVKEYIKLLLISETSNFASLLAMTFTNKAAFEMKERILLALDEIGNNQLFKGKQDALIEELSEEVGIDKDEVIQRCSSVLHSILHQYEDFNISTIDKFNLRLIKSFSKDLDLPADFNVIIEEDLLLQQVIDNLLSSMGKPDTKDLSAFVLKYAESKLEEGKKWDVRDELIKFGKYLTIEKDAEIIHHLKNKQFSLEDRNNLYIAKKSIEDGYLKLAKEFEVILDNADLSQINGKGQSEKALRKVCSEEILGNFEFLTEARTNIFIHQTKDPKVDESVLQKLKQLYNYWEDYRIEYAKLKIALKNFFNIALLKYMDESMHELRNEEHIVRISEFNELISELIRNENAPFIYERIGTKFQHFLLDEFQDTSHLQWVNLVPLLHNSISEGHRNLIVGDPKQSIYRFKNGIAEQFIELPAIYNPTNNNEIANTSKYFEANGIKLELNDNWRSAPEIVNFNNVFFEFYKSFSSEKAHSFYNSILQHPKSDKKGYVEVTSKSLKDNDYDPLPYLFEKVEECINDGIKGSQICILGRSNKECNNYAIALTDKGYKVISSDSLLIHNNMLVKLAIDYLYWRTKPFDDVYAKKFIEQFLRNTGADYTKFDKYISEEKYNDKTKRVIQKDAFIEDNFNQPVDFFGNFDSLYELIQNFFALMNWKELENPYLHHLADIIYGFEQKNGPDLKAFLSSYEDTKHKIAVQIPGSEDAITVMTIHKSKGLEFPVVILPDVNSKESKIKEALIESGDFVFFDTPSGKSVVPEIIEYGEEESEQAYIDSLNLYYVALTRPEYRLYVMHHFKRNNALGNNFHKSLELMDGSKTDEDTITYITGERLPIGATKKSSSTIDYIPKSLEDKLWFPDIALQDQKELIEGNYLSKEVQFGLQFHLILSELNDQQSVDEIIQSLVETGEVDKKNVDDLKIEVNHFLNHPTYQNFISDSTRILREQDIIVDYSKIIRPDLVIRKQNEAIIIDYKTGEETNKNHQQVKGYIAAFKDMGFSKVSGYLYYTETREFREA